MADTLVHRIEFDAAMDNIAVARRAVRERLTDVPAAVVDDLQLIVSELVTNAVEHGPVGPIAVELRRDDDSVCAAVESPAPEFSLPASVDWANPVAESTTGRGLAIVHHLADDIEIEHGDSTLVITVTRRL